MSSGETPIVRAVVESLLVALRAMGRGHAASTFEREFEARGWNVGADDQVRLLGALQPDPQLTLMPAAQLPLVAPPPVPRPHAVPPPPRFPAVVQPYTPFLSAIRDADRLLRALDRLARASRRAQVREAVCELFVEVLGFDRDEVDLTPRVRGRSQIGHFETLARHGEFHVALVEITEELSDTTWSATSAHFAPCFRLAPYALLVAIEPAVGTLRLVYTSKSRGRPWYRAMVAPSSIRDPNDDLLVWCKRFDLLRPRFGDDAVAVRERVDAALEASSHTIAQQWSSDAVAVDEPLPGLPFDNPAVAVLVSGFLQLGTPENERLMWGLVDALRQVFPAPLVYGSWRLECAGYQTDEEADDAEACWRRGETRAREVRLQLFVSTWQGEKVQGSEFEVRALVPVPDERGRFMLDGDPWVFRPRIGADGQFLTPPLVGASDEDDEEDGDEVEPETLDDELDPESPQTTPSEEPQHWPGAEGVAVDRHLRLGVEQRLRQHLRGIRPTVKRYLTEDAAPASFGRAVRAALAMRIDDRGRLPLVPRSLLFRLLDQAATDDVLLVTSTGLPTSRPPWACPVASSVADGRWVPIASARLHPCGALAVPATAEDGRLRLVVRSPSAPFDTEGLPRRWGLASQLGDWAAAATLHRPEALARAVPLEAARVVRSGAIPAGTAWLAPQLRPRRGRRVRLAVDVAWRPGVTAEPTLCAVEGAPIRGGTTWLRVPWEAVPWHAPPVDNAVDDVFRTMELTAPEPGVSHRIPPGAWRVVGAGLSRVSRGRSAPTGWRAWLDLIEDSDGSGAIVDDRSRWYRLVADPDDIPWSAESGDVPDVVLGTAGVETDGEWYSGADGELSDTVADPKSRVWWCAPNPVMSTEPSPPQSLLSGEWRDVRGVRRSAVREWAAMNPADAERATARLEATFGHAPSLVQAARVLLAARVPLPAVFPEVWRRLGAGPLVPVDPVECVPTESTMQRFSPRRKIRYPALFGASCGCGAWTGAAWRGRRCASCGDTVSDRPTGEGALPAIALPWPVLHPWRKDLAAALLGLTSVELDEVLVAWGPVYLRLAVTRAVEGGPLDAAHRRLVGSPGDSNPLPQRDRCAFGLVVQRLERRLATDPTLETLWLDAVPVPAPELMPAGLVLGAATAVAAPLLASFQRLRRGLLAAVDLRREPSDLVQRAAHVSVQRAVDGLFGTPDEPEGWGSLAAILAAVWPWSRRGDDRIGLPGLTWLGGEPLDELPDDRDEVRLFSRTGGPVPEQAASTIAPPTRLSAEEGRAQAVSRLVLGATGEQLSRWARPHALGVFQNPRDLRAALRRVRLASLLAALTDEELDWAYMLIAGTSPTSVSRADLQRRIVDVSSIGVRLGAAPQCGTEASPWGIPDGCVAVRPTPHQDPRPALLVGNKLVSLPVDRPTGTWEVDRAVARIRTAWWPWLAGVVEHVTAMLPTHVAPTSPDLVMAGIASALQDARPAVSELLALLEGPAVSLAADPRQAFDTVVERLRGLDDGSGAARATIDVLAVAWSGWCRGEPTAEHPLGAVWSPSGPPPERMRRTQLPAGHPAWSQWPAVLFVTRPARFAEDPDPPDWAPSPALRRWAGLPTDHAPSFEGLLRPSREPDAPVVAAVADLFFDTSHATPETMESVVEHEPPSAPAGDIQWWPGSAASWVHRTRGQG